MASMTAHMDGLPPGYVRVDDLSIAILAQKCFPREIRYKVEKLLKSLDYRHLDWAALRVQRMRGTDGAYHYVVPYDPLSTRKLQTVLSGFDPDSRSRELHGLTNANKLTYSPRARDVPVGKTKRIKRGPLTQAYDRRSRW